MRTQAFDQKCSEEKKRKKINKKNSNSLSFFSLSVGEFCPLVNAYWFYRRCKTTYERREINSTSQCLGSHCKLFLTLLEHLGHKYQEYKQCLWNWNHLHSIFAFLSEGSSAFTSKYGTKENSSNDNDLPYGSVVLTKIGSSFKTCLLSSVQFQISFLNWFRHSWSPIWAPFLTIPNNKG